MPSHYNDVRTPVIWTGVIKNEDFNALARIRDLPHLLRTAIGGIKKRANGPRYDERTDLSLKSNKFGTKIVQSMPN
jgi:hypothetical protein